MKTLIELSKKIFDTTGLLHRFDADGDLPEMISQVVVDKDRNPIMENGEEKTKLVPINGCTYNFNRDIDARCFKNALARFVRTGAKEDAFDVFFCYTQIFKTFGGYKRGINSLLQLLYDYEANSATLLKKHRDHYSHSVYVFALGLSIFMGNENMRAAFTKRYGAERAEYNFLKHWGIAALFHDIGYPYEISYLQVNEYGKKTECVKEKRLNMGYGNLNGYISLTPEEVAKCGEFMPQGKTDINSLFIAAFLDTFGNITHNREESAAILESKIQQQVENPNNPKDHGYYSAVLLLKALLKLDGFVLTRPILDAIMAIFLHNFYRFTYKEAAIENGKAYEQMHLMQQPLAYLLSLCDEIQCWDRIPYGEKSKEQELAWDIDLFIDTKTINIIYYFDKGNDTESVKKIQELATDIKNKCVNWEELATLNVSHAIKTRDKKVYDYFSDNKFIDLCKLAEAINISYESDCKAAKITDYMKGKFDELTLEYQLSNIAQAKHYVRHLENIHCFFSDKAYDYPIVQKFTDDELALLAVSEHIRWVNEKVEMGWSYGTDYNNRTEREKKRIHKDIVPYDELAGSEKDKDRAPINNMISHLSAHGIKIYRMHTDKKVYVLGCTGHIDLSRIKGFDEEQARGEIRAYLRKLQNDYDLKLLSGFADGADLLFAEEALNCGLEVIALLPYNWDIYMKEHADNGKKFMQLLGQVREVVIKPHVLTKYFNVSRYIVNECDELLALWDGVKLPLKDEKGNDIHVGGTYDTIVATYAQNKPVKLF
ncbi:MAG: hypothetical protein K2L88_06760 [Clostridiales bacterium]|nr:hypothetical protein [Clostridiales bacterium]